MELSFFFIFGKNVKKYSSNSLAKDLYFFWQVGKNRTRRALGVVISRQVGG
jgi:hypothetical protein